MQDRENKLIRKIEQSLSRIDEGIFGICEACGEDIAIKRLKARPVTTYCIACKNKMEVIEKAANFKSIQIDTNKLKKVYPFGQEVFKSNFLNVTDKRIRIRFSGPNALRIAPHYTNSRRA
jgi:hypothetical protein